MATFNKFNSFVEALAEKTHNLGADTLELALCASADAPQATYTVLANCTQISYANCSARTLTVTNSTQASGTYKLVANNITLTASTAGNVGPFRYIVLFNQTAASDELIGWYDYSTSLTLAAGESLAITFDSTGILTIA